MAQHVLLLLADEAPCLIKRQAVHADRLAVATGQARNSALADASQSAAMISITFLAGKVVHEAHPSG